MAKNLHRNATGWAVWAEFPEHQFYQGTLSLEQAPTIEAAIAFAKKHGTRAPIVVPVFANSEESWAYQERVQHACNRAYLAQNRVALGVDL